MRDHVYLIDPSRSLEDLLWCSLFGSGFVVQSIQDGDEDLHRITQNNTAAVFITVELPDKEGFARFTQVRKIAPRVPVVLFTSTLPASDFQLHEKLKNHADVYLDKRTLTASAFAQKLSDLLGQTVRQLASIESLTNFGELRTAASEDSSETQDICERITKNFDEPTARDEALDLIDGADGLDDVLVEALFSDGQGLEPAEIFADDTDSDGTKSEIQDSPSQRESDLIAEIELLKKEIEEVRRDARSSPFSDNFLKLRDLARSKDKEIIVLKRRIASLVGELTKSRKTYEDVSAELNRVGQAKTEAIAKADDLQRRLETAERDLIALRKESEEAKDRHASELERISADLERERASARAAAEQRESELEERRRQHAEAMSALRRKVTEETEALTQSHEKILAEKRQEIDDLRQALKETQAAKQRIEEHLQDRLNKTEQKFKADLKELETNQRNELEEVEATHRSELEAQEEKWRSKLESLEKEEYAIRRGLESRLEKAEQDWRSKQAALEKEILAVRRESEGKLKQMEEKHRSDVENAEKRHESERGALVSEHNAVIAELEHEAKVVRTAKEELEQQLTTERQNVVRDLDREKNLLAETKRVYEAKIHDLQFRNAQTIKDKELEWRMQLADIQGQQREERERAAKAVEAKWRDELKKKQREHNNAISALRAKHESTIEDLQRTRRLTTSLAAQFTPTRLQEQNEKLRRQISKMEDTISGQKTDISRRDGIIEDYERALGEREKVIASLKGVVEDSYRSAEAHLRDRADQEETIASLKAVVEDFRRSIESYTSDQTRRENVSPSPKAVPGDRSKLKTQGAVPNKRRNGPQQR